MRAGVVWLGAAILLTGTAWAGTQGAHDLDDEQLEAELVQNRVLASYVARNGPPDVAESHFLSDQPPWDDHEVTLYYLDMHKEIGFARAWILGSPSVNVVRYQRTLSDSDVASLEPRVRHRTAGDAVARAEAAAKRAEDAAGRTEAAADATDRAATRAEAVASKMETRFHRALRK